MVFPAVLPRFSGFLLTFVIFDFLYLQERQRQKEKTGGIILKIIPFKSMVKLTSVGKPIF